MTFRDRVKDAELGWDPYPGLLVRLVVLIRFYARKGTA
jgi:hypothetical protein